MLLNLRDRATNKLVGKDILDIDMDLSVFQTEDGKYSVNVNKSYITDESFATENEAEDYLRSIVSARNNIESTLMSYE